MVADPLDPFGRTPRRAGVFLDFDGVLADIAAEPDAARVRDGIPELLLGLAAHLGRVAIISGRPVDYVAPMVPTPIDIVGLYGLESRIGGEHLAVREAEPFRDIVTGLVEAARNRFGAAVVEPKGLSLTVHYRNDPALAPRMEKWVKEQAARTGMESRPAKRSFELHPPIERDKGTALCELAEGLHAVAYVGDDLGDLPAFDGLDELASTGVATLRVGVDSPEAPASLLARADVVVHGPAGAESFLQTLLATSAGTAPN